MRDLRPKSLKKTTRVRAISRGASSSAPTATTTPRFTAPLQAPIVCSLCGSPSWCFERTNLVERHQREVIELERSYTLRILRGDLPARGLT